MSRQRVNRRKWTVFKYDDVLHHATHFPVRDTIYRISIVLAFKRAINDSVRYFWPSISPFSKTSGCVWTRP